MNLHKSLFILLTICVLCVWTVVLVYAFPLKDENAVHIQPRINHKSHLEKEQMHWKWTSSDQSINQKEASTNDSSNPLDHVILQLSSEGTVSVDVLLKALEEKGS